MKPSDNKDKKGEDQIDEKADVKPDSKLIDDLGK